jgi:three-Cys-motif partner protein
MGKATFHTLSDGFLARDAPVWSEEKLMILDGYLGGGPACRGGFAKACRKAGGWYGLDLFAGTGLNWSLTREHEIDGSPRIALEAGEPKAIEVIVAEKVPRAFPVLRSRLEDFGSRAVLFNDDANAVIGEMLARVPRRAPAFAFLDPEGSELDWATVEAIADHKRGHSPYKVEQLILFPTDMGFVRLAPAHPEMVTRIFGHEEWKEIYARRSRGAIDADHARGEYVRMYADGLRRLGYRTVLDRQITKPSGHPMYFLIFATDNDAGRSIMDSVFDQVKIRKQDELAQGSLFEMKTIPRRTRLRAGDG